MVASDSGTLYVGVTGDLKRRIDEHVHGLFEGFSKKYGCHRLVWFETFEDVSRAIPREKQIKRWRREKKLFLIRKVNPAWRDMREIWERPE
jgi:putative endonuclease